jgi:osmoprotectant transport system permease protein
LKITALILILIFTTSFSSDKTVIRVGAKHFTEGYILSEMLSQILEAKGFVVERKFNLGGTLICFEALRKGEIDIYPEYTGTITKEILRSDDLGKLDSLGLKISKPYGFNNTYSLVVKESTPVKTISDLASHQDLRAGISYEFLKRQDGWDELAKTYSLPQQPTALEHGLAYQALLEGKIDVTDCYSTDGEISVNKLVILKDDKGFFPKYEAVSFYRSELDPAVENEIGELGSMITEAEMSSMNAEAIYGKRSFEEIARDFLLKKKILNTEQRTPNTEMDLISKTYQHLLLTFSALILAILIAIPLGVWLYFQPKLSSIILYIAGLLQTIPSIALLAFMIPLFGIGALPAIVALFLYAILPILRNTVNGLRNVDPLLKEVAASLGMSRIQALRFVEWPLALPTILTGIRIAAVINVGTATLAAFIGAGGLGEYIVTGLALNNTQMILKGAVPAAVLALLIEFIFEFIEKKSTPAHLRRKS